MATDNSSYFSSIDTPNDGDRQFICSGRYADCFRVNIHGKWLFVKVLKREYADDERCVQAFRKEQELGMMIDHPNIVRYYPMADDNSIWQDYVDGVSLDKFIEQNPKHFHKSENQRKFVGDLLSAVGYLHSHQIIHLDLKPQNIIITTQGNNVKLVDLGMAFHDTFTSTFGGTEGFSAPEIMDEDGGKPTFAADIYSIGRLMDIVGVRKRGIIKRCTKEEPSERYQDVEEIEKAFRRYRNNRIFLFATIAVMLLSLGAIALMPRQTTKEVEMATKELPVIEPIIDSSNVKQESVEAIQAEEEKPKQAVDDEDTIDRKTLAYVREMNEKAKNYQQDMQKLYGLLGKEKARIYAPLDKKIAMSDYSCNPSDLRTELRDLLDKCSEEMKESERRICGSMGYGERGFTTMEDYDYREKIDSVCNEIRELRKNDRQ